MRRAGAVLSVMRRIAAVLLLAGAVALLTFLFRHPSVAHHAQSSRAAGSHALGTLPSGAPTWWTGQIGLAARRVAGRVVMDGQPAGAAVVHLTTDDTSVGDWTLLSLLADDAGRFDFGQIPAGAYHVRAEKPGRVAGDAAVDLRDPDPRPAPDGLVIELGPCAMRVHGTVRDAAGGIVARARMRALQPVNRFLAHAVADEEGRYEVCAPSGPVQVEAAADGYGTGIERATGFADVRVDIDLHPEVVVSGLVLDEDGLPVAGAQVSAETGSRAPGAVTETDAAGRFRLDGLNEFGYAIVARSGDLAAQKSVSPALPGQSVELVLQLGPTATLRGRVVEAGAPLAGAIVAVATVDQGRTYGTALSQADGRFVLAGLPRRLVHLRIESHKLQQPLKLDLSRDSTGEVDSVCEHLATVSGRVTNAGRPVGGAIVYMNANRPGQPRAFAQADGTFEIAGVEPGAYELGADGWQDPPGIARAISVEVGARDIGDLVLELGPGATIAGEVVDSDGAPVAGATVSAYRTRLSDFGTATTGRDGRFLVPLLAGHGDYRLDVTVRDKHFQSSEELPKVPVPDENSHVTGIRIVGSFGHLTISGRVSRAGAPAAGIEVKASTGRFIVSATTDASGAYALTDLVPGTYYLMFTTGRSSPLAHRDRVAAGATGVDVEIPVTGSLQGTLVGFHDLATILLSNDRPGAFAHNVEGSFAISDIVPGTYRVTATTEDGHSGSAQVTIAADAVAHVTLTAGGVTEIDGVVTTWLTGEPVGGAYCRWQGDPPEASSGERMVRADAAGRFSMSVPSGRGRVMCYGGLEVRREILDLTHQSTVHVEVQLFVLSGRLRSRVRALPADRILAIDGIRVDGVSTEVITAFLAEHEPGIAIPIVIEHDGVERSTEITLEPAP